MTNWTPDLKARCGPRYRVIAEAIGADIAQGRLTTGDKLPTHRDLAWRLGVTVGTVTRAYGEAERRGLIRGEVGRGTFVSGGEAPQARSYRTPTDQLRGIDLSHAMAPASPEDDLLLAEFRAFARQSDLAETLYYQAHFGELRARAAAAAWLARRGLSISVSNIAMTAGGQHGILVALSSIARPGERILVEAVTYFGLYAAAAMLGIKIEPVAMDGQGVLPDALDNACRSKAAKALYLQPHLQNPTTACMSAARREAVAEVCRRHDLWIVEDDVFGYIDDSPPPLAVMAPERTLYVTSLSKCLAPGLRVGILALPPSREHLALRALQASCIMASPVTSRIAAQAIEDGTAVKLAAARGKEAAARREICLALFGNWDLHCPPGALFAWLVLPAPWRSADFAAEAEHRGVLVSPCERFTTARETPQHAVRICLGPPRDHTSLRQGLESIVGLLEDPGPVTGLPMV